MKFFWLQVRKALQVTCFKLWTIILKESCSLVNSVAKWFIIPRVRIKLLSMNFKSQKSWVLHIYTYFRKPIMTNKKFLFQVDWLHFSVLCMFVATIFSQNIIQHEKCPWTLEECLSPTIVPIHAYLLFGVVVDFVSRFFIRHENHRKKICQLMFAHCPFFWKLSTKTSCRQRQWVCCKSISGLASTVQRVNNGPNIF